MTQANSATHAPATDEQVLIVDDDPLIREGLLAILESGGRRIVACSDAAAAEVALQQFPFTHVVSDLQLSTVPFEGLTFVDKVRHVLPESRIVVMTGYDSALVRSTALAVGADAFLSKPCNSDQIASALRIDLAAEEELAPTDESLRVPEIAEVLAGGIEPHFQPIVELVSGTARIHGFESLARVPGDGWPFRDMGTLFEYARRSRKLEELNARCLEASFSRASGAMGRKLFVNVDPEVLGSRKVLEAVRAAVEKRQIDASRVVIEITENGDAYDEVKFLGAVDALRQLGIAFAIDDSESAARNLRLIEEIGPSYIKIGPMVGSALHTDHSKSAVIRRVVAMANTIGAEVILEGIASREALLHARQFGIRYGQGFWLGGPVPCEAVGTYSGASTN